VGACSRQAPPRIAARGVTCSLAAAPRPQAPSPEPFLAPHLQEDGARNGRFKLPTPLLAYPAYLLFRSPGEEPAIQHKRASG